MPAAAALRLAENEQRVTIAHPYRISRYPITVAQFAAFVQAGGYREPKYWQEAEAAGVWRDGQVMGFLDDEWRDQPAGFKEVFHTPNHPVVGVTWYEAVAFCRWLTERLLPVAASRQSAAHSSAEECGALTRRRYSEIRLPHEAEWEQAARWRGTVG